MNTLKHYPVWSNFIYFVSGLYVLMLGIGYSRLEFIIYSIVILLTGIFSILYHLNTPSYTGNQDTWNSKKYKNFMLLDQIFACLVVVLSFILFLWRGYLKTFWIYLDSRDFYLSILFIILACIFYVIGTKHNKKAKDCNKTVCFDTQLDAYDIFHSNWHIFTSIGLIFWTNTLLITY